MTTVKRRRGPTKKALAAVSRLLDDIIANPDAHPDFAVILPWDPALLSRIFTEERLRIWAELQRTRPKSLTELSQRLERNMSRVRQDVLVLEKAGLVKREKRGNQVATKAEALHIIIAPPE